MFRKEQKISHAPLHSTAELAHALIRHTSETHLLQLGRHFLNKRVSKYVDTASTFNKKRLTSNMTAKDTHTRANTNTDTNIKCVPSPIARW